MNKKKNILPWIAVGIWMIVIFFFSAQTGALSGDTSGSITRWLVEHIYIGFNDLSTIEQDSIMAIVHTVIRKGAHFSEFAVLAILISNAIKRYNLKNYLKWILPVCASAFYAVTDEIHQYFVPDRACRFFDVMIDTSGAMFGTALFMLLSFVFIKIKSKRKI